MKPWKQETVWVRRDDNGVIVGIQEQLPEGEEFIPVMLNERFLKGSESNVGRVAGVSGEFIRSK